MDLPHDTHDQQREDAPSSPERPSGFRTRIYGLFNGSSEIQTNRQHGVDDAQSPKPYTPRFGLRIFSSSPAETATETAQNRPEMSPVRRAPSSTYSMIDSAAASAATVRPLEPASLRIPDDRSGQRTRLQRAQQNPYPPSRGSDTGPAPVRVWVREPRWKREGSNRGRSCSGPVMKSKEVRRKLVSCLVTGFFLAIVLAICMNSPKPGFPIVRVFANRVRSKTLVWLSPMKQRARNSMSCLS